MSSEAYHALSTEPKGDAPLVFVMHGTGGDESQFFEVAQQMMPQAGLISPRGDVSEGGAARFFRRTGEGVYDMADLARATAKMAQYIESWTRRFPQSEVYAFGYSNGANILASVMMARPDLLNRVGLLHPLIPWAPEPVEGLQGQKVLITAGTRDPICPWPLTEQLVSWAQGQGADVSTLSHDGGHELRTQEAEALARFFTG